MISCIPLLCLPNFVNAFFNIKTMPKKISWCNIFFYFLESTFFQYYLKKEHCAAVTNLLRMSYLYINSGCFI